MKSGVPFAEVHRCAILHKSHSKGGSAWTIFVPEAYIVTAHCPNTNEVANAIAA
jgi:hypothetical protein